MASKDERRSRDAHRRVTVDAVAAYLADRDADVYNNADAAVRQDALMTALHLTALAGRAIRSLAEATGRSPHDVLHSLSRP